MLSFAHALVGTVICVAAGVLPKFWNTYLGHIGPASVMFILSELERFPGASSLPPRVAPPRSPGAPRRRETRRDAARDRHPPPRRTNPPRRALLTSPPPRAHPSGPNTVVTQGWTAIIGGASYLMYDLLFHGCHLDMTCHGLREQQHISVNTLLIVIGVDMVVQRSRFSASLIGLGFALFVGLHPQPNHMGVLIHQSAGVMLVVYAVARLNSRFDVCAKALYYASYLFFYGQNGFMVLFGGTKGGTGEEMPEMNGGEEMKGVEARIDDTAYVLYVLCLATVMSTLTETIDYAFLEGLPARLGGALGGGVFCGSPSKGNAGDGRRDVEAEFEMIRLTDDFDEERPPRGERQMSRD